MSRSRADRRSLVLGLLLLGCATGPARSPSGPGVELLQKPETFVARVARLRELAWRRPVPVVFNDEASFQRIASAKASKEAILPTPIDYPPVQLSLGLVFAAAGAGKPIGFGTLHRSQLVAFYDEFSHQVHVRQGASSDDELAFVVAHELGHALQFQHFAVPEVANVTDEDARLARLAVLEGDAMLVMATFAADEQHVPLSRALVRMAQGALDQSLKGYQNVLEQSPELRKAPPFQRERLAFPYQAGGRFMAELHRAGGFALVNRVYSMPPASSEQILHPHKYLAGELAVPVRAPKPPPGWELVQSGHVGEVLFRSVLDVCNQRALVERAAHGWGGDAFSVARQGEKGALLLATTWDSEADAIEFERAMRATASCWDRAPAATRAIFRGTTLVRRDTLHVGVTRGLAATQAREVAAQLPALVGVRPPQSAPFGPIAIPPVKVAIPQARPFIKAGQVVAARLGLAIPLTEGLLPTFEDHDVSFAGGKTGFASLIFAISELAFSPRAVRLSFDTFEQALKKPLAEEQEVNVVVDHAEVQTPVGMGVERVWRVKGTSIHGRLLLVPICGGTGMLVVGQGYASDATRDRLDRVVAGLRTLPSGSPICAELDP